MSILLLFVVITVILLLVASVPSNKMSMSDGKVMLVPKSTDPRLVIGSDRKFSDERGWIWKGKTCHGYYRTKHGAFKGKISKRGKNYHLVYIEIPPSQLHIFEDYSHWPCFNHKNKHMYNIHLNKQSTDGVDGIIKGVELLINQVYE